MGTVARRPDKPVQIMMIMQGWWVYVLWTVEGQKELECKLDRIDFYSILILRWCGDGCLEVFLCFN